MIAAFSRLSGLAARASNGEKRVRIDTPKVSFLILNSRSSGSLFRKMW